MTKKELKQKILKVLKVLNGREEAIIDTCWAELKRENAELRRRLDNLFNSDCWASEKLSKAKELLNACIIKARGNVNPSWTELISDIEQFLREIDIDNAIQKANEGLNLDKIAEEVEDDLRESCPDVLCENCTEEDCIARKLGLIC